MAYFVTKIHRTLLSHFKLGLNPPPAMHGHTYNNDTYTYSPEFLAMPGTVTPLPPPHTETNYFLTPPPLAIPAYELDSVYATSSGGYDSPSYTASPSMVIQRSGSSHSIATQFHNNGFFNQPVSSPTELLDSEGSSSTIMRRVFSAGDLQVFSIFLGLILSILILTLLSRYLYLY